jgi:hypothetical protein
MLKDDVGTVLARRPTTEVVAGFGAEGILVKTTAEIPDALVRARAAAEAGKPLLVNVWACANVLPGRGPFDVMAARRAGGRAPLGGRHPVSAIVRPCPKTRQDPLAASAARQEWLQDWT